MKYNYEPRLQMGDGIAYISASLSRSGALITSANNGLSLSGSIIQLGGPAGAASAANLLNNREIPFNTFSLEFSGVANGANNNSLIIKNFDATTITPQITFLSSSGAALGLIRFDPAGAGTMFIGLNAGVGTTGIRNIGIGRTAMASMTTGTRNIAMGDGAMQGGPGTQNNCIVIGDDGLDTSGAACGDGNIVIGNLSMDNGASVGATNTIIGGVINNTLGGAIGNNNFIVSAGGGFGGGMTNSIFISTVGTAANTFTLSNTIALGDSSQNTVLGSIVGGWVNNNSRLQVLGSFSVPQISTAVNYTQLVGDFTMIFTATATLTMLAASVAINRIIVIVAQAAAIVTTSINYTNLAGASVNTVAAGTSVMLQVNNAGTTWIQIK
jgi:hypothetical protein